MLQVSPFRHPALGRLIQLDGACALPLRLTAAEAYSIAAALRAVRDGLSAEHEIFLSPIACDDMFQALVEAQGIRCGGRLVAWPEVSSLVDRLTRCADGFD